MKIYLRAFVNQKQNNWARLLLMPDFVCNNTKNASTNHIYFKLNFGYHSYISFKDDANPYSRSRLVKKLAKKLRELVSIF